MQFVPLACLCKQVCRVLPGPIASTWLRLSSHVEDPIHEQVFLDALRLGNPRDASCRCARACDDVLRILFVRRRADVLNKTRGDPNRGSVERDVDPNEIQRDEPRFEIVSDPFYPFLLSSSDPQ